MVLSPHSGTMYELHGLSPEEINIVEGKSYMREIAFVVLRTSAGMITDEEIKIAENQT